MRARERDPVARLGLDIILSAQREMINTRAYEALERIPAVAADHWWTSPNVRLAGASQSAHVVAAGRRIALIHTACSATGCLKEMELGVCSLLELGAHDDLDVVPIASVADEWREPGWEVAASARLIAVTSTERLAGIVDRELDRGDAYDPDRCPGLTRRLHDARICQHQRAAALASLADELEPDGWLIAHAVHLPGLHWPIGLLAVGPTGIYVCEAAGLDAHRAAVDAVSGARHLARISQGTGVEVIPVVLCASGLAAHQLETTDRRRAWALPVDSAAAFIREVERAGLNRHQLRRLRKPAPGWEYRLAANESGWGYEIRYDLSRHDRSR
jgi:hypothetical protein